MRKPPTRKELFGKLMLNATTHPLPVVLGSGVAGAGFLLGAPVLFPLAGAFYVAGVIQTLVSEKEQDKVLAKLRAKHPDPNQGLLSLPGELDAPISDYLSRALYEADCMKKQANDADLPFIELQAEVDSLLSALGSLAKRAQSLKNYLESQDPHSLKTRLRGLGQSPEELSLKEALESQLSSQEKIKAQLSKFYNQMESMVASLGAMHAQMVQMSVAEENAAQRELAEKVRAMREEVETARAGLQEAYRDPLDELQGLSS